MTRHTEGRILRLLGELSQQVASQSAQLDRVESELASLKADVDVIRRRPVRLRLVLGKAVKA